MRIAKYFSLSILLIPFFFSCGSEQRPEHENAEEGTAIPSQVVFGKLAPISVGTEIQATGRVEVPPSDLISVHSRSEAFIDRIHVLAGEQVSQGTPLFTISHPNIIQKQRELLEAQAQWERAQAAYGRMNRLDSLGASYSSEREQVASDRAYWKARTDGLKAESSAIGIDVQQLMDTKEYQELISIRAPSDGHVQDVMVNRGMVVSSSQVLLQMTDARHLHLELSVPAKDAHKVELGQKVDFGLTGSFQRYSAKVVKVDPMLNASTGVLRVHCHLDSIAMRTLLPGSRVLARITADAQERYALPRSAVLKRGQEYFGFIRSAGALEEIQLKGAEEHEGSILFDDPHQNPKEDWVLDGAYYLE